MDAYKTRAPRIGSEYNPIPALVEEIEQAIHGRCDNINALLSEVQRCASGLMLPDSCYPEMKSIDEARELYSQFWAVSSSEVR